MPLPDRLQHRQPRRTVAEIIIDTRKRLNDPEEVAKLSPKEIGRLKLWLKKQEVRQKQIEKARVQKQAFQKKLIGKARIKKQAAAQFSGRSLALTALQRLVVAGLIAPKTYVDDDYSVSATTATRTHLPIKEMELAASACRDKLGNVDFNEKVSLICTVEYMRNSGKAVQLIDCFIHHKFDARAAALEAFPEEHGEFWCGVSSTKNLDTFSLRPLQLAGFFDNCMWLLAKEHAADGVTASHIRKLALCTSACHLLVPHFALALHAAGCLHVDALEEVERQVGTTVHLGTNTTAYLERSAQRPDVLVAEAQQVMDAANVKLTEAGKDAFKDVASMKLAFKRKLNLYIWSCQSLIIQQNALLLRQAFPRSEEAVPAQVKGWAHWRAPKCQPTLDADLSVS